jgi:hypothetical protein
MDAFLIRGVSPPGGIGLSKQHIHVLEGPSCSLGIQEPDDGCTGKIDGHEDEVNARAQVVEANGPNLRRENAPDRTTRRGKVKATSSNGRWEDLSTISVDSCEYA